MNARRRYLVMHGLRWLPTGLIIPIVVLLPRDRGLTLGQIGLVAAVQGVVVLFLELPTGGLADAIGRRPVVLGAGAVNLASLAVFFVADSVPMFFTAWLLQGIYRALDSGPLESWYVDAALAADPKADIESGLSAGGMVLGVAVSAGALLSGGLVAVAGLATPVLAAVAVQAVHLVVGVLLLAEPPRTRTHKNPIAGGLRLLRGSRVLMALIAVEVFWGFGMVSFETLLPVRLADVVGGEDIAGAIMGPAASAAWLAHALGAALVPLASRRFGVPATAAALRVLQGATVVGMALLAGPAGVLTAYLACYVVHGAANPLHQALLHRQVDGAYRTTVISMNSMMAQPGGAAGLVVLGTLADATTVSTAMLVGALVLATAAPLYLTARRAVPEPLGQV